MNYKTCTLILGGPRWFHRFNLQKYPSENVSGPFIDLRLDDPGLHATGRGMLCISVT
jgi:hypothetical protein